MLRPDTTVAGLQARWGKANWEKGCSAPNLGSGQDEDGGYKTSYPRVCS